jgi:hypothetical protein
MGGRRSLRTLGAAVGPVVLLALLLALPSGPAPSAPTLAGPLPPGPGRLLPATSGCPGASQPSTYQGQVSDVGGGSGAPAIGNQTVYLDYRYTRTFQVATGGASSATCVSTSQTTLTSGNGSFTLPAALPPASCVRYVGCLSYSGPYGPTEVGLANASLPAGYFLNETGGSGDLRLERVYALASVALAPPGFPTVSTEAPVQLTATPRAADGSRSPASVGYAWGLAGSGWALVGPATGAAIVVRAIPGAGLGTVTVWVNGSYGGATLHAPSSSTVLTAVATAVTDGGASPSSTDAGTPVTFTIDGTGAMGYPYSATITPAVGLADVDAPCSPGTIANGVQALSCSVEYRYPGRMTAQPTGVLSNGYSNASFAFAPVNVSLGLAVAVSPDPALAYAGVPLTIRASVAAGTGTPPYGPACLSNGLGNESCARAPGSAWTFDPVYAAAGRYAASLTVADAGGTNDSTPIAVTIVDRPALAPIALAAEAIRVGTTLRASSAVSGGALPILLWWNSTEGASVGPIVLRADAPLSENLSALVAGDYALTLTALDALGTRLSVGVPYAVVSASASAVALARSAAPSVTAGAPVALSFEAEDLLAGLVPSYQGTFSLWPTPAVDGGAWANASATGPANQVGDAFVFPAAAWQGGFLNLTFTDSHVGSVELTFPGGDGIDGPAPVTLVITADAWHETLRPAEVVRAGARSNATLYALTDRFGNPLPPGQLELRSVFGGQIALSSTPILELAGGSYAWVNYTSPNPSAGTIYVLGGPSDAVLLAIPVPAAAAAPIAASDLLLGVGAAAVGAAAVGGSVLVRRRRSRPVPIALARTEPEEGGEELALRRLAEGRAHVLARVPFARSVDLAFIAEGFPGEPPDAAELAEWVGSLVHEGLLVPSIGTEGRPEFRQQAAPAGRARPRVEIDQLALEAALARQRLEEPGDDGPPDGPSER